MKRVKIKEERHFKTGEDERRAPGRPKGALNKHHKLLKEAIILAAEARGEELGSEKGQELVTFLKHLATIYPKTFAVLLGKLIPYHIVGAMEHTVENIDSKEDIIAQLKERGIPIESVFPPVRKLTLHPEHKTEQ